MIQKKSFLLCFCFLLFTITITADEKPRIAVLPFNAINTSESDAQIITELFETALVKSDIYQVLEQNRMQEIMKAQKQSLSGCTDESCAIEVGKLLAADRVIMGSFSALGEQYILTAKIIDVERGRNLKADRIMAEDMDRIASKAEELAFQLAGIAAEAEPTEAPRPEPEPASGASEKSEGPSAELTNLYIQQEVLTKQIGKTKKVRSGKVIAGLLSLGVGIAGGGFGGFSFIRSNNLYTDYNSAQTPETASELHDKVVLWDGLAIAGVSVGGTGIITALIMLLTGPNANEAEEQLEKIETQIESLEGDQ